MREWDEDSRWKMLCNVGAVLTGLIFGVPLLIAVMGRLAQFFWRITEGML